MTATIFVDGKKLFLNPFMATLTGNIIDAAAQSLKAPQGLQIRFVMNGAQVNLFVDGSEVSLDLGHAQQIVGNLLSGLLRSLKGTETAKQFEFICEK